MRMGMALRTCGVARAGARGGERRRRRRRRKKTCTPSLLFPSFPPSACVAVAWAATHAIEAESAESSSSSSAYGVALLSLSLMPVELHAPGRRTLPSPRFFLPLLRKRLRRCFVWLFKRTPPRSLWKRMEGGRCLPEVHRPIGANSEWKLGAPASCGNQRRAAFPRTRRRAARLSRSVPSTASNVLLPSDAAATATRRPLQTDRSGQGLTLRPLAPSRGGPLGGSGCRAGPQPPPPPRHASLRPSG